jgi:hypothetical protein
MKYERDSKWYLANTTYSLINCFSVPIGGVCGGGGGLSVCVCVCVYVFGSEGGRN